MSSSKSGFTLIELLVTISIIAILSTVALTTYTTFIKNTRDAKRKTDLKTIQSALEEYRADQKYYPASDLIFSISDPDTPIPLTYTSKTYLNSVPVGPAGTREYSYKAYQTDNTACDNTASNKCLKYCLYAKLENGIEKTGLCPDQTDFTLEVTSP